MLEQRTEAYDAGIVDNEVWSDAKPVERSSNGIRVGHIGRHEGRTRWCFGDALRVEIDEPERPAVSVQGCADSTPNVASGAGDERESGRASHEWARSHVTGTVDHADNFSPFRCSRGGTGVRSILRPRHHR